MCLPALPALHDAEAPDLWKFAVRVFGDSPDFSLAAPAHKEIAGTAGARDKFGISQMVRSVRVFFRLPDADHDSSEGDLLPAPDPLCLRARFFGFIALVFPGAMPPHHYTIFFRQNGPALRQFAPTSRQVTPAIGRRSILSVTIKYMFLLVNRDRFFSLYRIK